MKAKEVKQMITSAYGNLMDLEKRGYWPLISPNPSSTEEKLIDSIKDAMEALLRVAYYHELRYGSMPEIDVTKAPSCTVVEVKRVTTKDEAIKEIEKRCREQIEDYEDRVQLALDYMERYHAPLSHADFHLDCEILAIIEEWCEEEGGENATFLQENISTDDIIFYREG